MSGIPFKKGELINNRSQMLDYFKQGGKPKDDWKIGVEIEVFLYEKQTRLPIQKKQVARIFDGFAKNHGWEIHFDEGSPISATKGLAAINLEAGGQIELSGEPHSSLHSCHEEQELFLKNLKEICDPLDVGVLFIGVFPKKWDNNRLVNNRSRYKLLTKILQKEGTLGTEMMTNVCAIHINFDYSSEQDMANKFRIGLALQPIVCSLFSASPFWHGKPSGHLSSRKHFLYNTSNKRSHFPKDFFNNSVTFESYLDFVLDVPMLFISRNNKSIPMDSMTFREFMENSKCEYIASMGDFENHLTTIFTQIRLKNYMEFRGADLPASQEDVMALTALWQGILYDSTSINAALSIIKDWTTEEITMLEEQSSKLSLSTVFREQKLSDIILQLLDISSLGLKRRGILNSIDEDESIYLEPAFLRAKSGESYAENILKKYNSDWEKSVDYLFKK